MQYKCEVFSRELSHIPMARPASFVGPLDSNGASAPDALIAQGEAWVLGWTHPVLFALFHRQPSEPDFERFVSPSERHRRLAGLVSTLRTLLRNW